MDSEQSNGTDTVQDKAYAGAGSRLRAAREAERLDLEHIAAETRIPLRHLEAIEAGDFAALPSRTYAIGFSRTYARVLGIDDAAIVAAVREELAVEPGRRSAVGSGMEPGDPAKLPSAGLAWFGAFAALVLAVGMIAFFGSRFGAGEGPAPLTAPTPAPQASAAPSPAPTTAATPAEGGEVVLTALEDGVWVRIYEEGGDRLLEKRLARDESYTVPADAADPRINTGRPDALAITVGGRPVAKLADSPVTIGAAPISAAALLARPQADPVAAAPPSAPARPAARRPRPAALSTAAEPVVAQPASAAGTGAEAPAPEPAALATPPAETRRD